MKPFVKWAGGKRQILTRISEFIQGSLGEATIEEVTYFEPFIGGGAVFFSIKPPKAVINDINSDLINAYKVIQSLKIHELINLLKDYQNTYFSEDRDEFYYEKRSLDRRPDWKDASPVEKAARMIFLNKTCYNGLYRVNLKGQFNTPIGRYKNPLICDDKNLLEIHEFLSNKKNNIEIMNASYEECIKKASLGDIIYVDPPYDYVDDDGFTKYHITGFTFEDFKKLKKVCDDALKRGAYVIISNNATDRVIKLFADDPNYKIYTYDLNKFTTLRSINCKGNQRKTAVEVIMWGIPTLIPIPQANDIEKVITLIMHEDNEIYKDKSRVKECLKLTTERQASYYLSAMKTFKYLNNAYEITEEALMLKKDRVALINDMINKLYDDKNIGYLIENKITDDYIIANQIKEGSSGKINDTTAKRRASTIKKWIKWALEEEQKSS